MISNYIKDVTFKIDHYSVSIIEQGLSNPYLTIIQSDDKTTYRTIIHFDKLIELVQSHPELCVDYNLDLNFKVA